jgi:hypothetical protein
VRALIYRAVTDRLFRPNGPIRPDDADLYLPAVELARSTRARVSMLLGSRGTEGRTPSRFTTFAVYGETPRKYLPTKRPKNRRRTCRSRLQVLATA